MADPILADIYRTQVVLQGKSGLPEDVFVNNWYFRNDVILAPIGDVLGAITRVLDSFYTGAASTGSRVSNFLSPYLNTPVFYHTYDLGQAPPRTRHRTIGAPLVGQGTNPLPTEVALCCSFFAGTNAKRNRGRIYIGPLATNVVVTSTGTLPVPAPGVLETIADRAANVGRTTENVTWVMVTRGGTKPPLDPPNAKVITAGWVDSAWDTQRRRGLKATGRTTFSAV